MIFFGVIFNKRGTMTDYFVAPLVAANAYINKMNILMGYPNPSTKTVTYAVARKHLNSPGMYLVIIKSVYSPNLNRNISIAEINAGSTVGEKTSRKSIEVLRSENAFPSNGIGII